MLKIKVETELSTHEPTADVGFVTWWTITVTRDPLGEEGAEIAVGSVRAATIHYGEVVDVAESLYDVLDADSGELEALSSVFFEEDWLRDEFEATGNGLFYVAEIDMPDVWRQRGADLAIVHRLSCTLAMGCSLLVLEPDEWSRKDQWGRMGFMPSNGDAGSFQFLNLTRDQPRVVSPARDDRFEILGPRNVPDEQDLD